MSATIERERYGDVLVLAPCGRLDSDRAAEFERAIEQALAGGARHLVFDLAGLDHIGDAGLRALGRLARSLDPPSTSLRIAGVRPPLRRLFDDAGVSMLFDFRTDRCAALAGHPAARSRELAAHLGRLYGSGPVAAGGVSADDERIAGLAIQLLGGCGRQTGAARAVAEGDRSMQHPPGAPAPAPRTRPAFWQRLRTHFQRR
jgi:anti-sigma B factor antagonist